MAIISKDYKTIWANRVLKQMFGDDVEGKTCYHTFNQRTEICPGCGVREIFEKGGDNAVHEQVGKGANGKTVWSQIIATAIRDEDGKTSAALELVVPITERKQIEDDLRKSEEMYRQLFESSQEGIVILDANTKKIIDANAFLLRLSGYSIEQIVGKEFSEIETFKHVEKDKIDFKKLQEKEYIRVAPLPIKTKEKASVDVEFVSSVFEHNSRRMIQCNIRNITEQLLLQEELRSYSEHLEELVKERTWKLSQSESRFRELADLLPEIVFDADEKGNLTFLNHVGFTKLGLTSQDVGNNVNLSQLFVQEEQNKITEGFDQILSGREVGVRELVMQTKNGNMFPTMIHTARIMREGKVVGLRGVAVDITTRKQIEKMRDQSISAVTHELRTPLVSIQGYLDLTPVRWRDLKPDQRRSGGGETELQRASPTGR